MALTKNQKSDLTWAIMVYAVAMGCVLAWLQGDRTDVTSVAVFLGLAFSAQLVGIVAVKWPH